MITPNNLSALFLIQVEVTTTDEDRIHYPPNQKKCNWQLLVGYVLPRLCYSAIDMASRSVNKVILLGRLGKDAETKFTPAGASVTKFTMATSSRWKDKQTGDWKEETEWHNIVAFRAENVSPYLLKGKQIYVEGRLQTRNYEDKDGQKKYFTEVVADDIILVGGGGGDRGDAPGGMDDMDSGFGGPPARSAGGPVSMPRSAQQRSAPPPARTSSPASTPFESEITDDDVPF